MVILGILAAVSMPFFAKLRRRAELRSAAMEVSTTLLAARMKAVRHNATTRVVITPNASEDGSHVFETIEPTPIPTPGVTPVANPGMQVRLSSKTFQFVTIPDDNTIAFDSAGRLLPPPPAPTPAVIVIEGPVRPGPKNQITIETSSGGRVRVVTPVEWQ
jgi:Tfp pilus assembly protein FimT